MDEMDQHIHTEATGSNTTKQVKGWKIKNININTKL